MIILKVRVRIYPLRLNVFADYIGPMRKYPRIEIDQKAFDGLQIEAVLQDKTVREIATNAILSHISKEAIMVLDHKTYEGTKTAEPPAPPKSRTRPAAQAGRPKQLARDIAGIAQIKDLWTKGMNMAEIARQIDRPRTTTQSMIDRMVAKGELPPRSESS